MEVRSCFHEQVVAERLVVPPNYLSNVSSHVIAVLNRRLLVCTNKFHGVLVCYRDVKLLKRAAVIVDEHPYVHADIRYTATVFRPIRGTVLEGVVTKLSDDHVACLVHDCFNASIPHPRQGDKARNGWPGFSLSVGDIVKFKVTNVDHARGVISIRGELVDENAGRKDENHTNDDDTTINAEEEIGQSAVVEDANSLTKKSRTKSFSKLKEKQQDMEAPEQVAIARNIAPEVDHSGPDDNRDNSHGSKKKSKKSKRGQFKETTAEDKSETLEKAGTVEVQIPRTKSVWAGLTKPAVLVLRDAGNATGRQSDRVIADSSSDHEVAASSHFVKTKKNRRRDHSDVSLLDIDKSRKRKSVASDTLSEVPLKKNRVDRVLEKTSQKSMSSHGFTSQSKKKKKLNHQSD